MKVYSDYFYRVTILARWLLLILLTVPVLAGVVGVVLPAFGYFPAIGANAVSMDVFARLFALDDAEKMIALSLITGVASTLIACLCAFSLLAVFYRTRVLSWLQGLFSPFLVLPHAAAAISLLFLLSPSGFFARLFTFDSDAIPSSSQSYFLFDELGLGIVLALIVKEVPFILLMALSVMSQPLIKEKINGYFNVGVSLGYSSISVFFTLILPVLYPQIRLPLLAVLVFAVSNVEIPLILGPNNPSTLAVAVLHWFNHIDLSMRLMASAAAVVQVGVAAVAIGLVILIENILAWLGERSWLSGKRTFGDDGLKLLSLFVVAGYAVLVAGTLFNLVLFSVAQHWPFPQVLPSGFTVLHWQSVLEAALEPIINTLILGSMVSLTALVLVLLALENEVLGSFNRAPDRAHSYQSNAGALLNIALFLPLLVPGVAFLYGLVWFQQIALKNAVWFHVYIAHIVYVMPYMFLSLAIAYRKLDSRYAMVAQSLGKSPTRVFLSIKLPLLAGPIMVAFALGLAISFSQYLPTLLATGGAISTVTTEAVAAASGSSMRLSAAYVIIQAVLPLVGFILAWWLPGVLFTPRKVQIKNKTTSPQPFRGS